MQMPTCLQITLSAAGLLALPFLSGCSGGGQTHPTQLYRMGERTTVGPLIYTVLEAEWRQQLGDGPNPRMPKHRFLVLRLAINNSSNRDVSVPLLSLVDSSGKTYQEESESLGVIDWLGLLRTIQASIPEEGRIIFDAPLAAYKLRVVDDGEVGQEQVAMIEIPLQLDAPAAAQ
jgi:hypothetical protein